MTTHSINPEPRTVHAGFSRAREPILTIDSGDTVRYRTLDAGWNLEPHHAPGVPGAKFEPRLPGGHALCGPIALRGMESGMVLEVQIKEVQPGPWGWTNAGGWESDLNARLGVADEPAHWLLWTLDPGAMRGHTQDGYTITLHPFMGVMGMPADEPGMQPSWPPRPTGGNLDCKELVAGSILYLPVAVPGGLFSVGDGHAAQGDGEVSSTGIECPMERVELTFVARSDLHLSLPRADTPAGWITFGFDQDLDQAITRALSGMLDLMTEQYRMSRKEALALASVVVDIRVTQLVNGVRGIHALLPHHALS